MPELPAALPPGERTVGQLIAESIRAYGNLFWRALPLGIPLALIDQLCAGRTLGVQVLIYWAAAPLVVAAYVRACTLVYKVPRGADGRTSSPCSSTRPFPPLRALYLVPGLAWFAFIGLAVPAALVERIGVRAALARGRELGRADYVHSLGSLAALVLVVGVADNTLIALLHTQSQASAADRPRPLGPRPQPAPLPRRRPALRRPGGPGRLAEIRTEEEWPLMPTYVLLSTLTQQGVQTLKAHPERLVQVNRDFEELGVKVLHQWATLGEFDFVNVVEAPDIETIAKASLTIAARGSVRIETLPALEIDAFLAKFLRTVGDGPCRQLSDHVTTGRTPRAMRDPRIDEYARLLVEHSVGVQPGWQVYLRSTPLARPLVEAVEEQIARRGAFPIMQLAWEALRRPVRAGGAARAARPPGAAPAPRSGRSATRSSRSARRRTCARARISPASGASSCRSGSSRCGGGRWRWRCPGWSASSRRTPPPRRRG